MRVWVWVSGITYILTCLLALYEAFRWFVWGEAISPSVVALIVVYVACDKILEVLNGLAAMED